MIIGAAFMICGASAQGQAAQGSTVVYCYDRARDIVSRQLSSECRGDVVDEAFAKKVQERRDAETLRAFQAQTSNGPEGLRLTRIGTAFYVDDAARLLTNNHVVQDCRALTVASKEDGVVVATVLAIDQGDDLALLGVKGSQHEVARFRGDDPIPGDTYVATVGYPDQGMPPLEPLMIDGTMLRAAEGMADGNMLFRAPVRRGNSGGPIFDSRGLVIGIVRARIDEVKTYSATGRIVEDTAVGVGLPTVLDFLQNNGANVLFAQSSELATTNDILKHAIDFVARAECWQ
jgi:serine protease Do